MNNILITGKKGFIGNQLNGKAFTGRVENYNALFDAADGVEGIVHLAAVANRKDCQDKPLQCITTNLVGLYNVLEVALKRNIWVLFISTYQIKEKTLYGLTKLTGEELCRIYKNKGLNIRIIRLPIVYGPNDKPYKVVTKIINDIKNGIEPEINNDDKFFFLYVDDAVKMIENEINIIFGGSNKKYSLYDLVDGIKKCLNEGKRKIKK